MNVTIHIEAATTAEAQIQMEQLLRGLPPQVQVVQEKPKAETKRNRKPKAETKPEPAEPTPEPVEAPSIDDLRAVLMKVVNEAPEDDGMVVVSSVLAKYDAKRASDVKEADRAAVIADLEAKLAA